MTNSKMKIVEKGILVHGVAGTKHATHTFPSIVSLSSGTLLATCRVGSKKDTDDETIELFRSENMGHTWTKGKQLFKDTRVNGVLGSFKICYLTEIKNGHLIAACMWVDRQTHPNKPLFNDKTEGCLPMKILLSNSYDDGNSWTALQVVSLPENLGPPSLTSPILKLKDGSIAMTIETNKPYLDSGKWYQKVILIHSFDNGKTWKEPIVIREDKSGEIFYWDLRTGVDSMGRIIAFSWTYNRDLNTYLNMQRVISLDDGKTWSKPEDIGITDQPSHPAILQNGHVVLAWVDRFKSNSIKVRMAKNINQSFDKNTELILHKQKLLSSIKQNTGELLDEMSLWNFGLPYVEVLPNDEAMVMYYAGNKDVLDIYWVKLKISDSN